MRIEVTGGGSTVTLREGTRTSGSAIANGSSISKDLNSSRDYTITASSRTTGNFTLTVKGRIPWLGHQQDHTIKYKIGRVQPPRTSPQPTNPVEDPATVLEVALSRSKTKWNQAVSFSSPRVLFCKDDTARGNANECLIGGIEKNTDNEDVFVNIEEGGNSGIPGHPDRVAPWFATVLPLPHCGNTYACVKPNGLIRWIPTIFKWLPVVGGHMQDMKLVMEESAWSYTGGFINGTFIRRYWTNTSSLHNDLLTVDEIRDTPGAKQGDRWANATGVMMHEFGHTAGLTDLYNFDIGGVRGYSDYMMRSNYGVSSVPLVDRAYIRQVYDGHNSH